MRKSKRLSAKVTPVPSNMATQEEDFLFTTLDDMMITEVMMNHFVNSLGRLKDSIERHKKRLRLFHGSYRQIYHEKRDLMNQYLKCRDWDEKEQLIKELVDKNLFIYSFARLYHDNRFFISFLEI